MEYCSDTQINPLCDEKFDNIEAGIDKVLKNQEDFHNKMFVDNGSKSYQTFRRFTESYINLQIWIYGIICTGVILTTVGIIIKQALK